MSNQEVIALLDELIAQREQMSLYKDPGVGLEAIPATLLIKKRKELRDGLE